MLDADNGIHPPKLRKKSERNPPNDSGQDQQKSPKRLVKCPFLRQGVNPNEKATNNQPDGMLSLMQTMESTHSS